MQNMGKACKVAYMDFLRVHMSTPNPGCSWGGSVPQPFSAHLTRQVQYRHCGWDDQWTRNMSFPLYLTAIMSSFRLVFRFSCKSSIPSKTFGRLTILWEELLVDVYINLVPSIWMALSTFNCIVPLKGKFLRLLIVMEQGLDGWQDLSSHVLFNSISVISGRWKSGDERLCSMGPWLRLERILTSRIRARDR